MLSLDSKNGNLRRVCADNRRRLSQCTIPYALELIDPNDTWYSDTTDRKDIRAVVKTVLSVQVPVRRHSDIKCHPNLSKLAGLKRFQSHDKD